MIREIVSEPGPRHHCQEALDMTKRSLNPLIADSMMQLGASHYLEVLTGPDGGVVRCIACGKMWSED